MWLLLADPEDLVERNIQVLQRLQNDPDLLKIVNKRKLVYLRHVLRGPHGHADKIDALGEKL